MHIYGPLTKNNTYRFQKAAGELPLTVKGMLGQGGFGVIYLVEDEKGKRQAVKFPGVEVDLDNDSVIDGLCSEYKISTRKKSERRIEVYRKVIIGYGKYRSFQKEIEYLEQHIHEHIIPIESLRLFGILCYRMPYYHSTLRDKMEAIGKGELENPELSTRFLTLVWKVARVLKKIHERGLVHRDIKPENIFLENEWQPEDPEKNWEPVVGDFGVAGEARLTGYWSVVGDLRYMSPGQKEGKEIRGEEQYKSDVYALGIILKEIFSSARIGRQLGYIITKATEENLEDAYNSERFAYALEEYLRPRIGELLKKFDEGKNWSALADWLDYCWDFFPQREREHYLKRIWSQKISSPFELHFFHKSKPEISDKERSLWKICRYFSEKSFAGIVNLLALQTKGRYRYLLSEKTAEVEFPLHTDKELLEFVCDLERILASLEQMGIKMTPNRNNICRAGGKLCLLPWRGNWRFLGKKLGKKRDNRELAELSLNFWVGEKVATGWLPDDRFYQQKYDRGWSDKEYLRELTKILLEASAGKLEGNLADSLKVVYRRARINEMKEGAKQAYDKVKQCARVIAEHMQEDLDPYCFTEFYEACEILLQAAYGNPVEQGAFSERKCEQLLGEENRLLSPSFEIRLGDIVPEKFSAVAAKALAQLENFSQPVRLCALSSQQWQKIFRQEAENFDADKAGEIVGENIYLINTGREGENFCLLRQKNREGISLKEKYAREKCDLLSAVELVNEVLEVKKRLQSLVKGEDYFNLLELYRDQDGRLYFDWLDVPAPSLGGVLNENLTEALSVFSHKVSELLANMLSCRPELSSLISSLKEFCPEAESAPDSYRLEVLKTPNQINLSAIEIVEGEKVLIGRRRNRTEYGKDLTIMDPRASKYHVVVELICGRLMLRDCNSSNGTFVEGRRVEEESISPGTTFQIGDSIVLFEKTDTGQTKPKERPIYSQALNGESLEELIARLGPVEVEDAARITAKIAEILHEQASKGLVFSPTPKDVLFDTTGLQLICRTVPDDSMGKKTNDSALVLGRLFYYLLTGKSLSDAFSGKGLGDLLAYLLYGEESDVYLRVPLLWEKRNPVDRTLPENILEILLSEEPGILELEKNKKFIEFLDGLELRKGSCWKKEFIETLEQDLMFQTLKELRLLMLRFQDLPALTGENDEALERKFESLLAKASELKENLL